MTKQDRAKPIPLDQNPKVFDEPGAIASLAKALRQGSLTLFIGAGVSRSASENFPSWVKLVYLCCKAKAIPWDETRALLSNEYLRKKMLEVRRSVAPSEYVKLVRSALYEGVTYNTALMRTDLLVALGSLTMSSIRGAARGVVTYNFDDVLEWYLGQHGYHVNITARMPSLNYRADVTLYHPHGFLPLIDEHLKHVNEDLVLDDASYKERAAAAGDPWNELQRTLLGTSVALFVGMSGDDPQVGQLCWHVYNKVVQKRRILGFILLKRDENSVDVHHFENGLVPIYYDDHGDLPELLLGIARAAVTVEG